MPHSRHPGIHWAAIRRHLALAPFLVSVCAFAQLQAPTPSNPYPMPPRNVSNQPPPTQPAPRRAVPRPARSPYKPEKPSPATTRPATVVPAVAPASTPAEKPGTIAPSLLTEPAQPATVRLASGKLTVVADNSSLSDILRQIAKAGGMKLNGLPRDQRIFGDYGPASPRKVLSELLDGSGCNFVMAGETSAGTPRELSVSSQAGGGASNAPSQPAVQNQAVQNQAAQNQAAQNRDEDNQDPDAAQPTQYEDEQDTQPPAPPAGAQNHVRTPQQVLQELKQMRQRERSH